MPGDGPAPPVLRPAVLGDVRAVRTLLAHAFADDPLLAWLFPAPSTRAESAAAYSGLNVEAYLALRVPPAPTRGRVVEADGSVVAAALWRWPDDDVAAPGLLPTPAGLLAALVGHSHLRVVAAGFAHLARARPTTPHAYLHYLAVDAAHRGHGHARRLVEEGLGRAADDGLPALLETANPANVALYERLGFAVRAEVRLGDGPPMWVMTTD